MINSFTSLSNVQHCIGNDERLFLFGTNRVGNAVLPETCSAQRNLGVATLLSRDSTLRKSCPCISQRVFPQMHCINIAVSSLFVTCNGALSGMHTVRGAKRDYNVTCSLALQSGATRLTRHFAQQTIFQRQYSVVQYYNTRNLSLIRLTITCYAIVICDFDAVVFIALNEVLKRHNGTNDTKQNVKNKRTNKLGSLLPCARLT